MTGNWVVGTITSLPNSSFISSPYFSWTDLSLYVSSSYSSFMTSLKEVM